MTMTIGQLANSVGVNIDTVRFYERKGLLMPDDRTAAGYRVYSRDAERRLHFIRKAKRLGFTLDEIAELLAFGTSPESTASDVKAATEAKIEEHRTRIAELTRLREVLTRLAEDCVGEGPTETCPILNHFYGDEGNASGALEDGASASSPPRVPAGPDNRR